jgi:hypothetical protein
MSGSLTINGLNGLYEMGTKGELNGESITYQVLGQLEGEPPPAAGGESVEVFAGLLSDAQHANDDKFLLSRLDPAVTKLFGEAVCQKTLAAREADPTFKLEILDVSGPAPWTWVVGNNSIPIAQAYTVNVNITVYGEQAQVPIHFGVEGDQLTWFTDCSKL